MLKDSRPSVLSSGVLAHVTRYPGIVWNHFDVQSVIAGSGRRLLGEEGSSSSLTVTLDHAKDPGEKI